LKRLGKADPCDTTLKIQTDDPLLVSLATVMAQWRKNVGGAGAKNRPAGDQLRNQRQRLPRGAAQRRSGPKWKHGEQMG